MTLLQIQHITSSPHSPQSNGFAEAMVKIAKNLMDHSTLQEKPWNFSLMEYRCPPLTANIPSPLELLTGCKPQMNFPSMPWDTSINREYHEALIKKHQMDISNELSISTYEPGQTVWCFDTIDRIWKPAIILEQAPELHSYWCKMEDSIQKLWRTWLYIKPCLNMTECEEKQMLEKNQTMENTFQYTSGMKGNELSIPNITSLPNTSSQSSDDTLAVKDTTMPSTTNMPLRRSARTMKGIPPQWLVINWCDDMTLSLWTYQCMILCIYQCEIGT